jgi:hypothetical protein
MRLKHHTVTLSNSFHNTSVNVRGPWETPEQAWFTIQCECFGDRPTKAAKACYGLIYKALYGMSDCTCGVVR